MRLRGAVLSLSVPDLTTQILELLTAREGSEFAATCRRCTGRLAALDRAIAEVAGKAVVVDSSKRPSRGVATPGRRSQRARCGTRIS